MGSEFGQEWEWNHDGQLQWDLLQHPAHGGLYGLVRDLNRLYRDEPALHQLDFDGAGFYWVDADNSEDSVLAFCRMPEHGHEHRIYVVINMTPVVREGYVLPVYDVGQYAELLNTDSVHYNGTNVGNAGTLTAKQRGDGQALELTLPPLAAIYIKKAVG